MYVHIIHISYIYIYTVSDHPRSYKGNLHVGPPGPKAGDVWSIGVAAVIVALGTEASCLEGQPSTGSGYVLNGLLVFLNGFWWLLLILINGSSWFLNSVKVCSRN